jgi:hypothetical protein
VSAILKDGLAAAGLGTKALPRRKGSAPQKLALAELLWKRMTVSQEWIAEKLAMRSALNVSQQLRQFDRAKANIKFSPERLGFLKVAWEPEGCRVILSGFCTLTPFSAGTHYF